MQLTLNLPTRLAYAPERFIWHQGVALWQKQVEQALAADRFALLWIWGPARYGKTHLALRLAEDALAARRTVKVWEGLELAESLAQPPGGGDCEVLVVDDADRPLSQVGLGSSGPWVQLVERLRVARAKLLLLGRRPISQLPCDEHIQSRLRAGQELIIAKPAEAELLTMLQALARQRGIALNSYSSKYLLRRLGTDLPALEKYLNRLRLQLDYLGAPMGFKQAAEAINEDWQG